ncbi:ead/Ea22-like family protein [Escherichia coli]|uniref:ead/Ea22-like family protein n=1 Tax=Escherichia coli TaxID=562 RepID=UPI000EADE00F|nr:ead/Ea22-like family protein [Escherichia coli]
MSKIDYQALREAAKRAIPAMERLLMLPADDDLLSEQELKDYGVDIDALNAFKFLAGPETVLALLDERERNQQYIKRRDQENEDIALTVGKLRVELGAAKKRIAELEAEPVSQTYNLPELIEGMEVSIDVSTCDADLGNRYFGTVTEALELDTAKNGYILLVQDAEPNFDVNGNSPVTQDGWISCSERMPAQDDWILIYSKHGEYMAGQVQGEYVELSDGTLSWLGNVLFWMPLPEPLQEVN